LFDHPLGPGPLTPTPLPPGERGGGEGFRPDGGEIIFNLPNGLQGYLLVDGQGRRINEGPTKIVSVKNRPDPTVINGISCMTCHARGMIEKADQIRGHVEKNPSSFNDDEIRLTRALYPPENEMTALLRRDAERFLKAVAA